jgi:hypothetical protein
MELHTGIVVIIALRGNMKTKKESRVTCGAVFHIGRMREQQKLLHWILTTTPTARYAQSAHIQIVTAVPLYAVLALEVATGMPRCEHIGESALGAQSATIKIKIGKRFALHVPKGGTRTK